MMALAYFRDWVGAVIKAWWGWLPSSAIAALLGYGSILGWWAVGKKTTATVFGLGVLYSFFVAWKREREKAEAEISKRGQPELTASFFVVSGDEPHWLLYLGNSSQYPAVGIHIRDITNGTKVLRFSCSNPIRPGNSPTMIQCWILEDGIKDRNNVLGLFKGENIIGQSSSRHVLKVVYCDLASKVSQRSWELSVPFWFDTLNKKIDTGSQTIERI
jgi:hypothetical protein